MTNFDSYYEDKNFTLLPHEPNQDERSARQHQHVMTLRRNSFGSREERDQLANKLKSCKSAARCKSAACVDCSKAYQRKWVGSLLPESSRKELFACTLVLNELAVPMGKLSTTSFAKIKKCIQQFFDEIGWIGPARGAIDLCLWVDGDQALPTVWMPHLHFITTARSANRLKELFARSRSKGKRVYRPLLCKPIKDAHRQIHYVFKFALVRTIAFKAKTRSARPTEQALTSAELTEALLWLGKEKASDRILVKKRPTPNAASMKGDTSNTTAMVAKTGNVPSHGVSGAATLQTQVAAATHTKAPQGVQVSKLSMSAQAAQRAGEQSLLTPRTNPSPKVTAVIHDVDKDLYSLEFMFSLLTGDTGKVVIPRAADTRKIFDELRNRGAALPPAYGAAKPIIDQALNEGSQTCRRVTGRCGWHDDQFVTPSWNIGGKLKFSEPTSTEFVAKGTLQEWRAGLQTACAASPYLEFAIGCAFAAPLLHMLGEQEGAVFHFAGESSTGKSLAIRAANSTLRRSGKSDIPTFDSTPASLDELLNRSSDMLVCVDELGRACGDASAIVRDFAYRSASGSGRRRSSVVQDAMPNLKWRVMGLTSGEESLDDYARASGEKLRLIEIPVPSSSRGGIFAAVADKARRTQLAQQVEATIAAHHGLALRKFVQHLSLNRKIATARTKSHVDKFMIAVSPGGAWEERLAKKFAFVFAGNAEAAKAGVAPWKPGKCMIAVKKMYNRAIRLVRSEKGYKTFLEKVRRELGNLPPIEAQSRDPGEPSSVGFQRHDNEHGRMIVLAQKWVNQILGTDYTRCIRNLKARGILISGADGKLTRQVAVANERRRWICLRQPLV